METDEDGAWITVSKKKGVPSKSVNSIPSMVKTGLESQPSAFVNLSIQESGAGSMIENGHRPPTPSGTSPPRKKSKKDPKKVLSSVLNCSLLSHYPMIKVNETAVNQKVSLTVIPTPAQSDGQDFRDLVLWILDDAVRPDWIEVTNKSYLRSVVVLLVPGLSPETFHINPSKGSEGRRMRRLGEIETPSSLSHFADIFTNMWLPKAPGTNTQLHSPLSAFLNCPLSAAQSLQRAREQKNRKGKL
jgi:hypothetical protein